MDKKKYLDLISSYIEGELSASEVKEVESFMSNNPKFSKDKDNLEKILNILSNTNKVKTSRNFMVELNQKIDHYESKKNVFSKFFNFIFNGRNEILIPSAGISLSIMMIFISSIYIYKNNSFNNQLVEHEKNSIENLEDIDSLDIDGQKIRLVGGNND